MELEDFLNYKKEENPLRTVFLRKLKLLELDPKISTDLITKLDLTVEVSVKQGFKLLLDFMNETLPQANIKNGVWSLPNGDDFYALRLKVYTTTNYTAEEIHNIGLLEVNRITSLMKEIINQLGYEGNLSVGEQMNNLNEDSHFLYSDVANR